MIKTQLDRVKVEVKALKQHMRAFLIANGYQPSANSVKSLMDDIKRVTVLNKTLTYNLAKVEDGYVVGAETFTSHQVFKGDIPSDINVGCYQIRDGKLYKDEAREEDVLSME